MLAALTLWALNDHVLKAAFHNGWTGKLSDVACLIAIPVLCAGGYELFARSPRRSRSRAILIGSAVTAGAIMALINTLPFAADAYRALMGIARYPLDATFALITTGTSVPYRMVELTMDATDLLTVPAAAVPVALARGRS